MLLKMAREKRKMENIARKKAQRAARLTGAIMKRNKRQNSRCEENLPIILNGRWNCNPRTESCQLECEQNYIRQIVYKTTKQQHTCY